MHRRTEGEKRKGERDLYNLAVGPLMQILCMPVIIIIIIVIVIPKFNAAAQVTYL